MVGGHLVSLSPKSMERLGPLGSPTGLYPDKKKLSAIRDSPAPTNAEEIENSFRGDATEQGGDPKTCTLRNDG